LGGAASVQVEAQCADPGVGQLDQVLIGDVGGYLGHADPSRTQFGEGGAEVALIEALERGGHDGTGRHAQRPNGDKVIGDGVGWRQVTLVRDQRKSGIDDMEMAIEYWIGRCGIGRYWVGGYSVGGYWVGGYWTRVYSTGGNRGC
jgi:hypothetical protein